MAVNDLFDKADCSWRNALLSGNAEYFDSLAEEIEALNEFGALTNTGSVGSVVLGEVFAYQQMSPIDAGLLIKHPSYEYFLGDIFLLMGLGANAVGVDTSKSHMSDAEAAVADMQGIAAKAAEIIKDLSLKKTKEGNGLEIEMKESFVDSKGNRWERLDAIEEVIRDVCIVTFKRPDLIDGMLVSLEQESPRKIVGEDWYICTNARGPASGKHPRGLYQFKEVAWVEAGKVRLPTGQLVSTVVGSYDNAFDARANIIASVALIIRNQEIATAKRVRMIDHLPSGKTLSDPAVIYLMHNQGVGGAKKLLMQGAAAVNQQMRFESVKARELVASIFKGV